MTSVPDAEPEVRQRTVSCDFAASDALDLTTGEVRALERTSKMDVMCYLGRYLGLSTFEANADVAGDDAGGICEVAPVPYGTAKPTFEDVIDVPGDATACAWQSNVLCGVNINPDSAACPGTGYIVRDAAREVTYRLLMVDDCRSASPSRSSSGPPSRSARCGAWSLAI